MKSIRVPLLLFALPAGLIALSPVSQVPLLLGRGAVAGGEIWRWWTGHWVHFSASHLGWNLAVLLAAGTWLERVRPGLLIRHALAAPPLIGLAVLCFEPRLDSYGGLSGLATGVVVLLALQRGRTSLPERWLWMGVLALVALKCIGDLLQLWPAFARYDDHFVRTSTTAHAAGAMAALLHDAIDRLSGWRRVMPEAPARTRPAHFLPCTNATIFRRDLWDSARGSSLRGSLECHESPCLHPRAARGRPRRSHRVHL